jgi:hypothetical protein
VAAAVGTLTASTRPGPFRRSRPTVIQEADVPSRVERQNSAHPRAAPAAARLLPRLREAARALNRWWAEERRYRPERRYMRG